MLRVVGVFGDVAGLGVFVEEGLGWVTVAPRVVVLAAA
jgi:hypothetical protein